MKIKTIFLTAFAAALIQLPAQAAIILDYDNVTGDYELAGSDAGPGEVVSGNLFYLWQFGSSTQNGGVRNILNAISPSMVGTVGGDPIITGAGASGAAGGGVRVLNPLQTGELFFPSQTGTISPSLWVDGVGSFIGAPQQSGLGPTTSNFTINVTAVPEPATFAALAGILALGFVACRRVRK